jgi:hypothetical protein
LPKRSCVQIIQSGAGGKEVQKRLGLLRAWGRRARCWAGEARESRRAREKRAAAPRARALLSLLRLSVSQRPRRLRGLPHACARPAGVQKGCGLVFCRKVGWEQLRAPCLPLPPSSQEGGEPEKGGGSSRCVWCGRENKRMGIFSGVAAQCGRRDQREQREAAGARSEGARPPAARSSLVSRLSAAAAGAVSWPLSLGFLSLSSLSLSRSPSLSLNMRRARSLSSEGQEKGCVAPEKQGRSRRVVWGALSLSSPRH